MFARRSKKLCFAVVFAGLVLGDIADGRPPRPPAQQVDKGFIYYGYSGQNWRMLPDGTQREVATVGGELSKALHGGEQWGLSVAPIDGEFYPDGLPRYEIFAVSASGLQVQLTDDATVEPMFNGTSPRPFERWSAHDGVPDAKVSYLARRWQDGAIVEAGLYAVAFDPETLGQGLAPMAPSKVAIDLPLREVTGFGIGHFATYDWSPDGLSVVFGTDCVGGCGLRVQRVGDPPTEITVLSTDGGTFANPRWSPIRSDGTSSIAFVVNLCCDRSIEVINPDGTGRYTLVASTGSTYSGKKPSSWFQWSPSGTYLAHGLETFGKHGWTGSYVCRIPYLGGTSTALTSDLAGFSAVVGWPRNE